MQEGTRAYNDSQCKQCVCLCEYKEQVMRVGCVIELSSHPILCLHGFLKRHQVHGGSDSIQDSTRYYLISGIPIFSLKKVRWVLELGSTVVSVCLLLVHGLHFSFSFPCSWYCLWNSHLACLRSTLLSTFLVQILLLHRLIMEVRLHSCYCKTKYSTKHGCTKWGLSIKVGPPQHPIFYST